VHHILTYSHNKNFVRLNVATKLKEKYFPSFGRMQNISPVNLELGDEGMLI
jgi:hypothetical protein